MKLKEMIEDLEKLENKYTELKLLLEDQIKDDEIDEANHTFEELLEYRGAIKQMKELEVHHMK